MTTPSAIAGVYADLRQVKSRGVWQLVLDIPAEKVEGMVELFGMPRQDEPTWLAVARLRGPPEAKATGHGNVAKADPPTAAASGGTKRRFSELPLPQQVALRCADESFQDWVLQNEGVSRDTIAHPVELVAVWVRQKCGVHSRADIKPGSLAEIAWKKLETRFLLETGRMAEEHAR